MQSYYLEDEVKNAGYKLRYYEEVGSTNDLALHLLRQLDLKNPDYILCKEQYDQLIKDWKDRHNKLWLLAERQTKGKGRGNKNWLSPRGNLYTSLLLIGEYNNDDIAAFCFVAGVSLIETINYYITYYDIKNLDMILKWPNDLLVNNKKISGILVESKSIANKVKAIVVGVGVNILQNVDLPQYPTSCLAELGFNCTSVDFFRKLSYYWMQNYNIYMNDGRNTILRKWLELGKFIGRSLLVKTAKEEIKGVFADLDENFNCIIKLKNGELKKICSAEVLLI